MPIIEATLTISSIFRMMLARLPTKPCKVRSTRRCCISAPTLPVRTLISHQPISRVSSASVSFPPYSSSTGNQASDTFTSWSTFISMGVLLRYFSNAKPSRHGQATAAKVQRTLGLRRESVAKVPLSRGSC
ncbi:hypothetical protein D9M68_954090 [compost metagenome]